MNAERPFVPAEAEGLDEAVATRAPAADGRASFAEPRILLPFLLVTLIWGSTWIVIRDQLGHVPPFWSIAYRFVIAAAAMFAFAALRRDPLRLPRAGAAVAVVLGLSQFTLNFGFVYAAEAYVTSGLVAVVFAMLFLPNALLGRAFLGQRVPARFVGGSAIAAAGIALLFAQEWRAGAGSSTLLGILLTIGGVLSASVGNVLQATSRVRALPIATLLAWSMAVSVVANGAIALVLSGPPAWDPRPAYLAGLLWLGVAASALAFFLYYGVVRAVGPARAAYSSVLVPVIAMGFSTVFEDYHWSTLAVAGGGLALVGLLVALGGPRR